MLWLNMLIAVSAIHGTVSSKGQKQEENDIKNGLSYFRYDNLNLRGSVAMLAKCVVRPCCWIPDGVLQHGTFCAWLELPMPLYSMMIAFDFKLF